MRKINRALRQTRRLVPAVALTAALVAGGAVTAVPAFADAGPLSLTVHTPAVIGAAGGPVEFTETIANPGDQGFGVVLELSIETPAGAPPHALSLDYGNELLGGWESVELQAHTEADKVVYSGTTDKLVIPPGGTDVRLRLGAPMGEPHNGAGNGGVGPVLTFRTAVKGWRLDHPVEPPVSDTHTIKVKAISNHLLEVPATVVAGGAPIEFDAVLRNPTPSAYTNLGNVLFADRHAKVEVRGDDGTWTALPAVTTEAEPPAGFYLDGRNSSAAPDSLVTKRVRVSYSADTPLGKTELNPCVFVNEADGLPFRGTTMCSPGASVQVVAPTAPKPTAQDPAPAAAPADTSTDTPAASAKQKPGAGAPVRAAGDVTQAPAATPAPTSTPSANVPVPAADGGVNAEVTAAQAADANLASTGADSDRTGLFAGAGAVLLGVGGGALAVIRRRRRAG
ncbi:LAETG motif-containing sortase-dependent surface protein [Kitasatospora sp. NPDC058190]|uniref:LAETG motif-containing sortase-dependent surface protein n=1 Tax=Kitasatospora sp. NPDC058190 TaxID=3346371 RepID=UPI0036DC2D39